MLTIKLNKIINKIMIEKFDKYKQNLTRVGDDIYSYSTKVAIIDGVNNKLYQLGYWSQTTQKHINYVAREMDLEIEETAIPPINDNIKNNK